MSTIELSDDMARSEWDEFEVGEIFSGNTPLPRIRNERMSAELRSAGCQAGTVLGLSSGLLVVSVSGSIGAVGILCVDVAAGSPDQEFPIFAAGCFNPDMLIWHSSYDSDPKKFVAFDQNGLNNNAVVKRNTFTQHLTLPVYGGSNTNPVAPPLALGDLTVGVGLVQSSAQLLAGATDADGDTLTVTSVTAVSGGTVSGTGPWTITPTAEGAGSATAVISDGRVGTVNRTVSWNGVAATSNTIVATLSGGGLGPAPVIYGGDFRNGGADGTAVPAGTGTPWTGGYHTGTASYASDGRGGTALDSGKDGSLSVLFPRSGKIGCFYKDTIATGGKFNAAATPGVFPAASARKPIWLLDTAGGGTFGYADLCLLTHPSQGNCSNAGNSINMGSMPDYRMFFALDGSQWHNHIFDIDIGADKASATSETISLTKRTRGLVTAVTGDSNNSDNTGFVREFDRAHVNGWVSGVADGDTLIGVAYFVVDADSKIQVLIGDAPHLHLCTDVEFIVPDAWTDTSITITVPLHLVATHQWAFIRDRAGVWRSCALTGGSVALTAGLGQKPQLYLNPADYTGGVHITTGGLANRRNTRSTWTCSGDWRGQAVITVESYTGAKPLVGNDASGGDYWGISAAGAVECRINGVTATIGSLSAVAAAGTKGVLTIEHVGETISATFTAQGGSAASVGSVAFNPGRGPQLGCLLRNYSSYPENIRVFALACSEIANPDNASLWKFMPPSEPVNYKWVYCAWGSQNHADQGAGSSYLSVGSTPTTTGAWFSE